MNMTVPHPLVQRITSWVYESQGLTAVHAGHFMLIPFVHTAEQKKCVPAILQELDEYEDNGNQAQWKATVERLIANFPMTTWQMGVELVSLLGQANREAKLLTLVNDWYFLRGISVATKQRRQFYECQNLVPSYEKALYAVGLNEDDILQLGPHSKWVSEYWLRRSAERRLKATNHPSLRRRISSDGIKELVFDDLQSECRQLLCGGRADCAAEVSELLYLLNKKGYTALVNFIPRECEEPVNNGCEQAMQLYGIKNLRVLNIALPCLGGGVQDSKIIQDARIHSISTSQIAGGAIIPSKVTVAAESWIS